MKRMLTVAAVVLLFESGSARADFRTAFFEVLIEQGGKAATFLYAKRGDMAVSLTAAAVWDLSKAAFSKTPAVNECSTIDATTIKCGDGRRYVATDLKSEMDRLTGTRGTTTGGSVTINKYINTTNNTMNLTTSSDDMTWILKDVRDRRVRLFRPDLLPYPTALETPSGAAASPSHVVPITDAASSSLGAPATTGAATAVTGSPFPGVAPADGTRRLQGFDGLHLSAATRALLDEDQSADAKFLQRIGKSTTMADILTEIRAKK